MYELVALWICYISYTMPSVNPEILVWARETAGLTQEEAARKLDIRQTKKATALDRLAGYESGKEDPSRPLLLRMARQYRRPLLTFYLPVPPSKGDRGADFRTLPGDAQSTSEAAILDALLRDTKARQGMVRALLEDEDELLSLPFVGSQSMTDGKSVVLDTLGAALELHIDDYRAQRNADAAFNYVRAKAEERGIFVLLKGDLGSHHTAIELEVFRGFSIADDIAPFIVINDRDTRAAWTFTLLHEIVHLILGQSGVSGLQSGNDTEWFCDDVAGEFLFPTHESAELGLQDTMNLDEMAERIGVFARERNLSRTMVAYRGYRSEIIQNSQYRELSRMFRAQWIRQRDAQREQLRAQDRGPNPYVVRRHRLGRRLTSLVGRLMATGELSTSRAARILDARPTQVQAIVSSGMRN